MMLDHPDTPAAVAVATTLALAGICLAGARHADTTTVCRWIAARPFALFAVGVAVGHLGHVTHQHHQENTP